MSHPSLKTCQGEKGRLFTWIFKQGFQKGHPPHLGIRGWSLQPKWGWTAGWRKIGLLSSETEVQLPVTLKADYMVGFSEVCTEA